MYELWIDQPIFRQGFCKSVFEMPSAGDWIMRPGLVRRTWILRIVIWPMKKIQLQPHIVYLAVSSGLSGGYYEKHKCPRWIDQGAHQTIPIVEVPNRYLAGITEVALKSHTMTKPTGDKC